MFPLLTLLLIVVGWSVVRQLAGRSTRLSAALGPVLLVTVVGAICFAVVEGLVAVTGNSNQRLWLMLPYMFWAPAMVLTSGFAIGGVIAALTPGGPTRASEARRIAALKAELAALPAEPSPTFGRR